MEYCIIASYLENKSKTECNNWQATTSMFVKGENLVISRLHQIQMQLLLNICQLCIQKSPVDNPFNSNWCNIFDRKVLKNNGFDNYICDVGNNIYLGWKCCLANIVFVVSAILWLLDDADRFELWTVGQKMIMICYCWLIKSHWIGLQAEAEVSIAR